MSEPRELKPGDTLSAGWLNALRRMVFQNRLILNGSDGIEGRVTPFGTVLRVTASVLSNFLRPAQAPAGGILGRAGAVPGSGTVTFFGWDGSSFALGTETATARNPFTAAVGAGKFVWVVRWLGGWWIIAADCP